jgi:hypothetical protein
MLLEKSLENLLEELLERLLENLPAGSVSGLIVQRQFRPQAELVQRRRPGLVGTVRLFDCSTVPTVRLFDCSTVPTARLWTVPTVRLFAHTNSIGTGFGISFFSNASPNSRFTPARPRSP